MNKMISLAKIMFTGLAIFLLIRAAGNVLMAVAYVQQFTLESVGILAFNLVLSIAYIVAIIYFLIYKRDKWAHKLIAKDIEPDQLLNKDITLTVVFRLVSVGAGLYSLNTFMWSISTLMRNLMLAMQADQQGDNTRTFYTGAFSPDYFQPILYLAFAAYLLCGAPHFVRWQVKKTLELCNEPGNDIKPVE